MKITGIETFVVDAGWRPWQFVAVRTDAGITGYGECSDGRNPYGVVSTVHDFEAVLLGQDPRPVEMRYWDLYRTARQSPGGIAAKAIAGIELALWDIKAKALGVPVYELFGGPVRERQLVYWSHCGTSRARSASLIGVPPLRSMDDIARLGEEVVRRGFRALKTNIVYPGDPAHVHFGGFGGGPGTTDQNVTTEMLEHIVTLLGTFRRAVGPHVGIALDLNFNFKPEAARRICKALEARAMDVVMIDVPWNGFAQSKKIADLAESYELNVAPHNYYSHLSTLHSAHLCACVPNVRIMEVDIDDVPWKDELVDRPPVIENGEVVIPTLPGWGANLNEDVARKHRWEPGRAPGYTSRS